MKFTRWVPALLLCFGISTVAMAQGAGSVQRTTKLAVSEPTMIGNVMLDPGSYTLHVNDYQSEKVQVVVTRDSDSKTIGTVIAARTRRSLDSHQASDNQTQFTYTTFNGHPAVATWFYPGDEWGEEFAYGKETVAENTTGGEVTMTQTPAPTASTSTMAESTPPKEESTVAESTPAPAPAPEPAPEAKTLPKTASSTPLVALLGALSLAGAAAVRFGRRKAA
ncbi:MAG TPA: LPXTG cell wall anchor domain-containing protein [Thermoanaerobaculia bacterium]|jgi:LPXTG-motif cell wall-anchored protein|nr:LPXTG cell wall anchor domain-containing protein [Thermoanaerobaculia bacterium]